ncbi:SDR family NAD(P)-dependent oxidoreductase [Chitinivibrio alkaliphilus]|uniref:Short-chain dehydrogenase/reductase SDR n=1 Tax=Chitinivibrio alkaliphilus ACht1 TaxID=1313304 RepID=U7DBE4_9BACT|nr:SDR family NAD(P)-dependent oxidoreductase [Chitinivibrio alkaliphilus]ERP31745.1 short-chain dehydrogenase/reductase SDR [Chitinivibrio alkaliphilus ACht1]
MSIALITGASSGIGREFVRQLDSQGFHELWIVARRKERLAAVAAECTTPTKAIVCDLSRTEEIEKTLRPLIKNAPHPFSCVVNNAGFGKVGRVSQLSREGQMTMVDLNCRAVVAVTHLVLPYMDTSGTLIQVSSAASFGPLGGFAVYAATKAFVTSFSLALWAELAEENIHVMAMCPGPTESEFSRVAHEEGKSPSAIFDSKYAVAPVVEKALRDAAQKKRYSIYGKKEQFLFHLRTLLPDSFIARASLKKIVGISPSHRRKNTPPEKTT